LHTSCRGREGCARVCPNDPQVWGAQATKGEQAEEQGEIDRERWAQHP